MKDYLLYGVEDFVTDESYLRYYFKENEADIRFWTEWIKRHPEKLDVVLSANNYIDAFSVRLSEADFLKEQQRFAETLSGLSMPRHKRKRIVLWSAAVAAITIGVVAFLTMQQHQSRQETSGAPGTIAYASPETSKTNAKPGAQPGVRMIEKYVPKGERARITLPDGSDVELNSDSRLTYPSKFTGSARDLKLSGEAFFRVKQDQQHPFHVISAHLVITVLGTSFNMQCYPGQIQTKVALVSGKVRLDRISDPVSRQVMGEPLVLAPSEMGVFDKQSLWLGKVNYDLDEETGWRQGIMVFKDADFNEIADRLDKVYNIHLVNKSHKIVFEFNGTFADASGEEIVKRLCLSNNLSYITDGNAITIH